MWIWLTIISALFLGVYDIAKKKSLEYNGARMVLLVSTAISAVILIPLAVKYFPSPLNHLKILFKAALVAASWVSGMIALKYLPITTVSTLKATRPFFVVILSLVIFSERLNLWQWAGTALAFAGIMLLSVTSRSEGISFTHSKGVLAMAVSIITGVASAIYDKILMSSLDVLEVMSWAGIYVTLLLGAFVLATSAKEGLPHFKWDWNILVIAVLIVAADICYFVALKDEGAMLSVISMIRRGSVIISFFGGALLFKEKQVGRKALDIALVLAGIVCLALGSSL